MNYKIIFVSNYFNHHQAALSAAFYQKTSGSFRFIQTIPMETERVNMGWGISNLPQFVIEFYKDDEHKRQCQEIINCADIVIMGSAPEELIRERIKKGKFVFRYTERIFKKIELYKFPIRFFKFRKKNPRNANIYLLCASAYTAGDYEKFGLFKNKAFKWGYFPEVKRYDNIDEIIKTKTPVSILWTARFIDWKHPEIPIKIAKKLKADGYKFELSMIGDGVEREKIENLIKKYSLGDCVHLLGTMSPKEVRKNMEKSEIFLFTSDRQEGWGAVLNESINSGCVVVANKAIGSVPYLIKEGVNGFTYKNRNIDELYDKVKFLINNPEKRKEIGKAAYLTILNEWNAEVAAERFIELASALVDGRTVKYDDGPCSYAEIVKDGWYKG